MASSSKLSNVLLGDLVPLAEHDLLIGTSENFKPETKQTVCYIVSAVLINEEGKILMIQEAKPSCRGKWYLPAGRMEPNENIVEACQREVLEETGLQCTPTTLLSVDSQSHLWFRFNFAAVATGGELKTTANADEESLQAGWFTQEEIEHGIRLRYKDVLPIINLAVNFRNTETERKHLPLMPHVVPHKKLICKYVLYQTPNRGEDYYVLHTTHDKEHGYPAAVIHTQDYNVLATTRRMLKEIIDGVNPDIKIIPRLRGVVSIEFSGKPKFENDGMCITILVELKQGGKEQEQQELLKVKPKLQWFLLSGEEKQILEKNISNLGCVALSGK